MGRLHTKLILAIFFAALIVAGAFYLTVKRRAIEQNIQPLVSVNENKNKASQVPQDILKMIGPPPGFDASKTSELDQEILKLIGPPPGFKPSTPTGEVSPEILKLIGPPDKIN